MRLLAAIFVFSFALQSHALRKSCEFAKYNMGTRKELTSFLDTLKAVKNSNEFAEHVQFPLRVNTKPRTTVNNKSELNAQFKKIMTDDVRSSIHYTKPRRVFCNSQGLSLDKGKLWLKYLNGAYKVIVINP